MNGPELPPPAGRGVRLILLDPGCATEIELRPDDIVAARREDETMVECVERHAERRHFFSVYLEANGSGLSGPEWVQHAWIVHQLRDIVVRELELMDVLQEECCSSNLAQAAEHVKSLLDALARGEDVTPGYPSCDHCECDIKPEEENLHRCPSCEDHVCIDCFLGDLCEWCCSKSEKGRR